MLKQQELQELQENILAGIIALPEHSADIFLILEPQYFNFTILKKIFEYCKNNTNYFQTLFFEDTHNFFQEHFPDENILDLLTRLQQKGLSIFFSKQLTKNAELLRECFYKLQCVKMIEEELSILKNDPCYPFDKALTAVKSNIEYTGTKLHNTKFNHPPFYSLGFEVLNSLRKGEQNAPIATGFEVLDKIIEGFATSQLITIGGRSGVGKSFFLLKLILNFLEQGYGVAFWSLEMNKTEIFKRIFMIFLKEEINIDKHYDELLAFLNRKRPPMILVTNEITSLDLFFLEVKTLIEQKVKIIIIDHLQLISLEGKESSKNRTSELEKITRTFKKMANDLDILIILSSQLSRDLYKRKDQTPQLFDLRDSGSIEQDSNKVLLLYKQKEKDGTENKKCSIAKNREGKIADILLDF